MNLFTKQWRTLALAAVLAVCWIGCVVDSDGDDVIQKWMTSNLNIETEDSWCYEDNAENCAKYGRLYTWSAAKSACQLAGSGWRLPTREDWEALVSAAGGSSVAGKNLKSKTGWNSNGNGTDTYGFSALPGGYRSSDGYFDHVGVFGNWWTATVGSTDDAYIRLMAYYGDDLYDGDRNEDFAYSVRCVRD